MPFGVRSQQERCRQGTCVCGPDHTGQGRVTEDHRQFHQARLCHAGPHTRRAGYGAHPPHGGRSHTAGAGRTRAAVSCAAAHFAKQGCSGSMPLGNATRTSLLHLINVERIVLCDFVRPNSCSLESKRAADRKSLCKI